MKRKHQSFRWLLLMFLCCVSFATQAATVNIEGYTPIEKSEDYSIFIVDNSQITVSSSAGRFDCIIIDDEQVAHNSESYWSSYDIDISSYLDNQLHMLQLKSGSNNYGICYFSSDESAAKDGLIYSITDETASVIGALKDIEIANIKSEYEYNGVSYTVTSIDSYAFRGCSKLAEVSIPNTVTSIGGSAFEDCTSLAAITITENVISIGSYAFRGCSALTDLTFNAVNCENFSSSVFPTTIERLTFGDNVTNIPSYFLYYGSRIEHITIPNSVTTIGSYTFEDCTSLKSLTLGSGLISIDSYAFRGCSIAKAFWLSNTPPQGATLINAQVNYVANNQYSLSNQTVYPFLSSKFIVDGTVFVPVSPSDRTCDVVDCMYSPDFTNIVISDKISNRGIEMTVNEIKSYSFYQNNNIESIQISNQGSIGEKAFYDCDNLQSATVSNQGSIGMQAFMDCPNLTDAILGQEITGIYGAAFANCSTLKEIIIPDSVNQLGESAFRDCISLENVTMGTGVAVLSESVFSGCSSLSTLFIPNNVQSIEDYAFQGCSSLSDIVIEDDYINDDFQQQTFPDWISNNHEDNSISYQEYKFYARSGDILTFNYSVDSESSYDWLEIKLNDEIIVNESGYNKSGRYQKIFTKNEEVSLYMQYAKDSSGNNGLDQASVTDIWINGDGMTIYLTLGSNGSSPLFADCPLDEVYIGRKLSYNTDSRNGYSPFYRNTTLRTVEITDAETQIYDNEFYGCSNLKSLKIGNGVTTIGNWAFSGCSSLDYFSAGYQVESIGEEAFSDCTGLTKYYSYSVNPPVCGNQALDDINKWDCTLYVPANSNDEYRSADQWKEFFFIDEMEAVLVAEIHLNVSEVSIGVGETFQLTAEILPLNATDQLLRWESSNPECVTVDDNGLISAISEGTATITVKSADGNSEASCLVSITPTGIHDIITDPTDGVYVVYNLQGNLILKTRNIEDIQQIIPGIYIVNGKKILVR